MKKCLIALALGGPLSPAAGQIVDFGLFIERFDSGGFEVFINAETSEPLFESVLLDLSSELVPFESEGGTEFSLDVTVEGDLISFLLNDEGSVDFEFRFLDGRVAVYRFALASVFGPQVDFAALPGFAREPALEVGEPSVLRWLEPDGPLGSFLAVFIDGLSGDEPLFAEFSPLPVPVLNTPPPSLALTDTSVALPDDVAAQPLIVLISYGVSLGNLDLQLVEGTPIEFQLEDAVFLSTTELELLPCSAADRAAPFGLLDGGDARSAVGAVAAGDPNADADFNGSLDLFDVIAALRQIDLGCP